MHAIIGGGSWPTVTRTEASQLRSQSHDVPLPLFHIFYGFAFYQSSVITCVYKS